MSTPFVKQVNFDREGLMGTNLHKSSIEGSLETLADLVKTLFFRKAKSTNNRLTDFIKTHICKGSEHECLISAEMKSKNQSIKWKKT